MKRACEAGATWRLDCVRQPCHVRSVDHRCWKPSTLPSMDKRADRDTGLGLTLDVDAAEFDRMPTSCGE